jgi:hypothetical protein
MPNGVNPLVRAVQPACPHPLRNRLPAQAQNDELMKGDDPILPPG